MTHVKHGRRGECSGYNIDSIEGVKERYAAGLRTIWRKPMWLAQTNESTTAATTVLALSRPLKSARVTLVLVHVAQTSDILTLEEKASPAGLEQHWYAFSSRKKI